MTEEAKKRGKKANTLPKIEQSGLLIGDVGSAVKGKETKEIPILSEAFADAAEFIALNMDEEKRKEWKSSKFYNMCMNAEKSIFKSSSKIRYKVKWPDEKEKIAEQYEIKVKLKDGKEASLEWSPNNTTLELLSKDGKLIESQTDCELTATEKMIKNKCGDIGLQVLQLIDGKKTADEIMKKAGLSESKLIEIFDFMAEQRIIKLGLARGKGQIVSPAKKEAFGPLLSRTISIKRKRLEKYLRAAIKHYKKNEYAKAIEYYAKLINYYDTNGMLYNNRGCAYYKKQKFQDAIKDFNKAIKLKADYLEPYYNRGLSYASIEEYEKAAADFSKVIQFNPKFTKAYHLRGLCYEYSGNYNTAKFDYEKALKLNPELEEAKTHLRSIEEKIRKELRALPSKSGREETIDPNLLLLSPSCSLSDVGGMTELKELLRNEVERFLDEEKSKLAEKFGLDSSSAILLYGPPGCGKSRIIESLTGEFDCKLMKINISDILSKWYGTAEKNMHEIFEYAKTNQPIILFFDEIEALGGSREDISEHWARTMINQFLLEMDSVWKRKERILVMGATNAPWHVDNALMRSGRFGKTIFISSPDGKSRKEIFGIYVSKIKLKGKIDCEKLAKLTEGFSGANIEFICKEAALKKFNDSIAKGKEIKVCTDDFIEAINELRKRKTDVERWQDTIKKYHLDIESFPDVMPLKSNKKGSSGRMFG